MVMFLIVIDLDNYILISSKENDAIGVTFLIEELSEPRITFFYTH